MAELDRLSAAISQLLDRSRDQRWLAAQDVDLDALVAAVVAALGGDPGAGRQAAGDRSRVRHEAGGAGTVHVDRVTLRLLVVTLLEQALEATDGRGAWWRPSTPAPCVEIRVRGEAGERGRVTGAGGRTLGHALAGDAATQELARALGGQLSPRGDASDGGRRTSREECRIYPAQCDPQTCRTRHDLVHVCPGSQRTDAVIERYGVLGEPAGRDLRALVDLAAQVCGVAHAAINLVTETEQHQVAAAGFDASVCAREDSMCAVGPPRHRHGAGVRRQPGRPLPRQPVRHR